MKPYIVTLVSTIEMQITAESKEDAERKASLKSLQEVTLDYGDYFVVNIQENGLNSI